MSNEQRLKESRFGLEHLVVLMLLIIAVIPMMSIGFTTVDDVDISINYGLTGNLFEVAEHLAVNQGRISFFWGFPLLRFPYLIDQRLWFYCIKLIGFLALIYAIYFAFFNIFKSRYIPLFAIFSYLAFLQNGLEYNIYGSYPFAFNIYAASFLISLGCFSVSLDQNKHIYSWFSALFYILAMASEVFILFVPLFFLVYIFKAGNNEKNKFFTLKNLLKLAPPAIALLLYVCIYFLWGIYHPSGYDGNTIIKPTAENFINVVYRLSISSSPIDSIQYVRDIYSTLNLSSGYVVGAASASMENLNIIKVVLVVCFLLNYFFIRNDQIEFKIIVWVLLISFIYIFIPNVFLGLSSKYTTYVNNGGRGVIYTGYSYIAFSTCLMFSLLLCKKIISYVRPWIRIAIFIITVSLLGGISFAIDLRNNQINYDQILSTKKWELMEVVMDSDIFKSMPHGSEISAPSLIGHLRGIAGGFAEYWSFRASDKQAKKIVFHEHDCAGRLSCYSLVFRQAEWSDSQFIVMTKAADNQPQDSQYVSEIFFTPSDKHRVLVGTYNSNLNDPHLYIDGMKVENLSNGAFIYELNRWPLNVALRKMTLFSNFPISPESITFSQYNIRPSL